MIESLLDTVEIETLINLLEKVDHIDGCVAEVGVYQGGSAIEIAKNTKSTVFLFDTFEGMPNFSEEYDGEWKKGSFSDVNFNEIINAFNNFKNVLIYKGEFPKKNSELIKDKKFKFVHLDVDNYQSYKECLEFFYSKIIKGGIIVLDDYNKKCCRGANFAVDEFLKNKKEKLLFLNNTFYIIKK